MQWRLHSISLFETGQSARTWVRFKTTPVSLTKWSIRFLFTPDVGLARMKDSKIKVWCPLRCTGRKEIASHQHCPISDVLDKLCNCPKETTARPKAHCICLRQQPLLEVNLANISLVVWDKVSRICRIHMNILEIRTGQQGANKPAADESKKRRIFATQKATPPFATTW